MKKLHLFLYLALLSTTTSLAQGTGTTDWTTATGNAAETQYTQNVTIPGCATPIVVTLTLSGSGADNVNSGSSGSAGTGTSNRLNTNLKFDNPSESLVWTVTFSVPVTNVNFTVWQIDRTVSTSPANFQDQVTFAGSPTITPASASASVQSFSGSTITGISNISSTSLNNSPKVDYGSTAITSFSFTWTNGPDISGSAFPTGYSSQTMGLGAINMTRAACPLPVTLTAFTSKSSQEGVSLVWQTASESNSDRFEVERSNNAKSFERLGNIVAAYESSDNQNYNFIDRMPVEGWNYYRLKMIDKDASFEYSRIIAHNYEVNDVYLEIDETKNNLIILKTNAETPIFEVFDLMGRSVLQKITATTTNQYQLQTSVYSTGLYIIKMQNSIYKFTRKIVLSN